MAAFEAALCVSSLYSSFPCYSSKFFSSPKPSAPLKLHISNSTLPFPSMRDYRRTSSKRKRRRRRRNGGKSQQQNQKRKLYVGNLPWSLTVVDIKNLFGECGTVQDVEIIKQQNGKSRGFAFVTMDSGEEAVAAIDKFHSHVCYPELSLQSNLRYLLHCPPNPQVGETCYKLYVSNLGWKVRSSHLRDFELMGRPINLKFSEKNIGDFGSQKEEEDRFEGQPEES
ncbi:29 kDa ribonucleoprotein A [Pyrus ussuriensis x Pyrus communis]|uniref:29 kDa ribonucleoprotein A n=1 Tax=Pyrus ussuriensis x Pyrus communis TaxID=2448454 RepID=A0A5N5HDZ0_9ROSA|nr:29 kDa ribonucleoprotein A [Pyrus ussuriensis x Pyrus communis]